MTPTNAPGSGPPARRRDDPRAVRAPAVRSAPSASGAGRRGPDRPTARIRWRRIPGRIILAVCFVLGAAVLASVVLPFSAVNAEGVDLRCGPAVFEVLMPPDPAFDDVPENAGCAEPARVRLLVAGGALLAVLVIVAVTDWRTRRGSKQRDSRWLATSTRRRRRSTRSSRSRSTSRSTPDAGASIGAGAADASGEPARPSLPSPRR